MLRERIDQHQLLVFVLIAFGWTWAWDAVYYTFGWWNTFPTTLPRQWGVPLGAIVVVWAGEIPLRTWLRSRLNWRVHPALFLVALLIPLGITNG